VTLTHVFRRFESYQPCQIIMQNFKLGFFGKATIFTIVYGLMFHLIVPELYFGGAGFFGTLVYMAVLVMMLIDENDNNR
jgi:hypothetical protein